MIRIQAIWLWVLAGSLATADPLVNSFGTVTGADDADQAAPIWGMQFTPKQGMKPAGEYESVYLQSFSLQSSSSGSKQRFKRQMVYLHVYDGFEVGARGKITGLGRLVTRSSHAIEVEGGMSYRTLKWKFDGMAALKADKTYMVVMSTEADKAATPEDYKHLLAGAFELMPGDKYAGGHAVLANSNRKDWDLEFRAVFGTEAGSGAGPAALLNLGSLTLVVEEEE